MVKIKIVATVLLGEPSADLPSFNAETALNAISPIIFTGGSHDDYTRQMIITPSADLSSVTVRDQMPWGEFTDYVIPAAPGGATNDDGSRLITALDVPRLPWKSSGMEITLPDAIAFSMLNFKRVIYRAPQVNIFGFGDGRFSTATVRVYANDVLLCAPPDAAVYMESGGVNEQGVYHTFYLTRFDVVYPMLDSGWENGLVWMVDTPAGGGGGGQVGDGRGGHSTLRRKTRIAVTPGLPGRPGVPGHWLEIPDPPPPPPAVVKFFPFGQLGGGGGALSGIRYEEIKGVTGVSSGGGSSTNAGTSTVVAIHMPDGTKQVIRV